MSAAPAELSMISFISVQLCIPKLIYFVSLFYKPENIMRNTDRPVDPMLINLGKRDQDYILYYGDQPLRTSGGHDYCHPSDRLLRMIMLDIFDRQSIKKDEVSPALLFELQKDLIEHGRDPVQK